MRLEDLIQQCTVELGIRGQESGTGFFIAPGYILSCEHVVREMGPSIPVRWGHIPNFSEATILEVLPKFDIGILRFTPPRPDLPCVLLDEADPEITDKLYLFGYGSASPNGDPVTVSVEGKTGDRPAYIKYQVGAIKPGMSGAALVNCRTGKVCGMSKYTMNSGSLEGGGGVSLSTIQGCLSLHYPEILESQASFHQEDRRWQESLPLVMKSSSERSSASNGEEQLVELSDIQRSHLQRLHVQLDAAYRQKSRSSGIDRVRAQEDIDQLESEIQELRGE